MRRRSFHVVFVIAILASMLAAGGVALRYFRLIERDRPIRTLAEIQSAPDDQLDARLRSATESDDEASQSLVILALAHDRPALRRAARELLAERLDRWRLLSASESTERVERLALLLGQSIDRLPEDSRPAAVDIATQILLWPVEISADADDRSEQLVAQCVKILRSAGSTRALDDPRASITRQPERLPRPESPERLR